MLALQRRRTLVQGLAALVRLRDPAGAAPLLEELRASAGEAPWWTGVADEVEAHLLVGLLHEGQGDRTAASAELLAGLAAADLRRSTISNDELRTAVSGQVVVADLVRTASRVALDDGRPAEAAELAMRGQARALVDLVSGAATHVAKDAGPGRRHSRTSTPRWPTGEGRTPPSRPRAAGSSSRSLPRPVPRP